jgi:hypothetical protein
MLALSMNVTRWGKELMVKFGTSKESVEVGMGKKNAVKVYLKLMVAVMSSDGDMNMNRPKAPCTRGKRPISPPMERSGTLYRSGLTLNIQTKLVPAYRIKSAELGLTKDHSVFIPEARLILRAVANAARRR